VKTLFALGRAVRLTSGMKVGWVLSSTKIAVGVVCALGGMVSKGEIVGALGILSKGKIFLKFELTAEEGKARGNGFSCCIFVRNCKNHG